MLQRIKLFIKYLVGWAPPTIGWNSVNGYVMFLLKCGLKIFNSNCKLGSKCGFSVGNAHPTLSVAI